MVAKSVDSRCPAPRGAEGQYRANGLVPVCNEQVLPAKAKVCSGLRRNAKKATEMIASTLKRVSNKIGDRSCPAGRMYVLNTKYVHFYVDPLMFFRWSESRTWPNQLVDIRILSLRLAMVYKARMFAWVGDGWTA